MSALKSLPEVETAGWYVRTRITDEDRDGSIVSNSGASLADHYAYAHTYGNTIAALTCEAINVARETGIGPAELRRQRDELLAALKNVMGRVFEEDMGCSCSDNHCAYCRVSEAAVVVSRCLHGGES